MHWKSVKVQLASYSFCKSDLELKLLFFKLHLCLFWCKMFSENNFPINDLWCRWKLFPSLWCQLCCWLWNHCNFMPMSLPPHPYASVTPTCSLKHLPNSPLFPSKSPPSETLFPWSSCRMQMVSMPSKFLKTIFLNIIFWSPLNRINLWLPKIFLKLNIFLFSSFYVEIKEVLLLVLICVFERLQSLESLLEVHF